MSLLTAVYVYGSSGLALALAIALMVSAALAFARLIRLRSDRRTADAAERNEVAKVTYLVIKHVPPALRTGSLADELPIIRQQIGAKIVRGAKTAAVLVALAGCSGVLSFVAVRHTVSVVLASAPEVDWSKDAVNLIQGMWGWKYDFERSCAQNPHEITLSPEDRKLTIVFKEPYWDGQKSVRSVVFLILSPEKQGLRLMRDASGDSRDELGREINWHFAFQDKNTYLVKRSDQPLASTGVIVRCKPEPGTAAK